MVNRRELIAGLGGLFTGGSALIGTGALTAVEADRAVGIRTAGDANAVLGIAPGNGADEYVTVADTVEVDITNTSTGGRGVNQHAITAIDHLLEITNNGTNSVAVGFDTQYAIDEGDYTAAELPGGWGYAVTAVGDAAMVFWASPQPTNMDKSTAEIRPGLTTTGFGASSTLVDGRTIHTEVGDRSERTIAPGESINIGLLVDTRESTVGENPIPAALDNTITLLAAHVDG